METRFGNYLRSHLLYVYTVAGAAKNQAGLHGLGKPLGLSSN